MQEKGCKVLHHRAELDSNIGKLACFILLLKLVIQFYFQLVLFRYMLSTPYNELSSSYLLNSIAFTKFNEEKEKERDNNEALATLYYLPLFNRNPDPLFIPKSYISAAPSTSPNLSNFNDSNFEALKIQIATANHDAHLAVKVLQNILKSPSTEYLEESIDNDYDT
ncbi:hypothetical protein POM88_008630 [Heracleum sosnowskyi]|uniref:Uncharacterized protein n=1 Tax=Heracleum sosnowskyi TaxID=360622 RepID=A0AAD8J6S5_9APIA|nr:hypothetical protein POM88_008630 [Heracleum sosnowskyi]